MKTKPIFIPVVLALGCGHAPETKSEKPVASNVAQAPAPTRTDGSEKVCSVDLDCGDKQLCIRQRCIDITADLLECGQVRIHFQFNSSEIAPADRPSLERSARCLKADSKMHVTIEGNTDERGTEEYNIALGDQRATAIAKYLQALGVSQDQLRTVSYGKENPLCAEHDEACWSKNRRALVKPTQGAPAKK